MTENTDELEELPMEPISIFEDPDFFAWFERRPPEIQAAIREYPPDRRYRLKSSGHVVVITSYTERKGAWTCAMCTNGIMPGHEHLDDGAEVVTVKAAVLKKYNPALTFERVVFGIPLDDLVEVTPSDSST